MKQKNRKIEQSAAGIVCVLTLHTVDHTEHRRLEPNGTRAALKQGFRHWFTLRGKYVNKGRGDLLKKWRDFTLSILLFLEKKKTSETSFLFLLFNLHPFNPFPIALNESDLLQRSNSWNGSMGLERGGGTAAEEEKGWGGGQRGKSERWRLSLVWRWESVMGGGGGKGG